MAKQAESAALRDGDYANAYLFSATGSNIKPPLPKMIAFGSFSVLAMGSGFTILGKKK
jgi:hypothetical protein